MPVTIEQEGCSGCPKKTHLILYAGRALSQSHVHTFRNASLQLLKDYKNHGGYADHTIIHGSFNNGEEFVEIINSMPNGSIVSLDALSHGNQAGLHIAEGLSPPEQSPLFRRNAHLRIRNAEGKNPVTEEQALYMEEYMGGIYSDWDRIDYVSWYYNQKYERDSFIDRVFNGLFLDGIAFLNEIKSRKFADDSFVELHGCNTAEYLPYFNDLYDNFAEDLAERIGSGSTVVGHIVNANPNHPNGQEDYRHGKVRVYHGNMLLSASESDALERSDLTFENSSTPPLNKE